MDHDSDKNLAAFLARFCGHVLACFVELARCIQVLRDELGEKKTASALSLLLFASLFSVKGWMLFRAFLYFYFWNFVKQSLPFLHFITVSSLAYIMSSRCTRLHILRRICGALSVVTISLISSDMPSTSKSIPKFLELFAGPCQSARNKGAHREIDLRDPLDALLITGASGASLQNLCKIQFFRNWLH